jgi:hypothetical protein
MKTKQKQGFKNVCKFITNEKLKLYISIQTLYLALCWSTCRLLGFDAINLAHLYGEFLPFFSADPLKLCQVVWGVSLHSYFQVSPEMFDQVQFQALTWPHKDIQRLVPKPLLHCLGCVSLSCWKVNLCPCLRSWSRFSSRISEVLCSVNFSLDPD